MPTLVGVFGSSEQALEAVEALRGSQLHTDSLRLVGRTEETAELASAESAGAAIAAGPPKSVVDSLLGADLSPDELEQARRRVEEGGVVVVADELDEGTAKSLAEHLRRHQAENVIIKPEP